MNIGIVGHEGAKFTLDGEAAARVIIRGLLIDNPEATIVSGHCHLGGVDIWAEEEAKALGREMLIYPPKSLNWSSGYKPRNIKIAKNSDIVHVIVVDKLAPTYTGMRFHACHHCQSNEHVKSGGCWTALYAAKLGKRTKWHIIEQK